MFVVVFDYMDCTGEVGTAKVAYSYTQIFAKKSQVNSFLSFHKKRAENESGLYGLYCWAKVDEVDFDDKKCTFYAPSAPDFHVHLDALTRKNLAEAADYVSDKTRLHREYMRRLEMHREWGRTA